MGKLALNINKKVFAAAKEKLGEGFDEDVHLEPGRYNGTIEKIDIVQNGDQVIFRIHVPEANDGKGGRTSVWFNMTSEERAVWLLRLLAKFGFDMAALDQDDIAAALEQIQEKKPTVRVRVREKDGYTNVTIDSVVDAGSDPAPKTEAKPSTTKAAPAAKKEEKPAAKADDDEQVVDEEVKEEPVAEEASVDLKPGMKLFATVQGEKQKVEIVELHEKEEKVTVKLKDGKKYKVGLSKLSID